MLDHEAIDRRRRSRGRDDEEEEEEDDNDYDDEGCIAFGRDGGVILPEKQRFTSGPPKRKSRIADSP